MEKQPELRITQIILEQQDSQESIGIPRLLSDVKFFTLKKRKYSCSLFYQN